jgi:hypothetical protein
VRDIHPPVVKYYAGTLIELKKMRSSVEKFPNNSYIPLPIYSVKRFKSALWISVKYFLRQFYRKLSIQILCYFYRFGMERQEWL